MRVTGYPDLRIEDLRELFGNVRVGIQHIIKNTGQHTVGLFHRDNMLHEHWTFDKQRSDVGPIATITFTMADVNKSPYDYADMLMNEVWKREFPVSAKLKEIQAQSQKCGELLEWLKSKKIYMATYHEHTDQCYDSDAIGIAPGSPKRGPFCGYCEDILTPYSYQGNIPDLLAEFFGIDQEALEAEKQRMLDELR